MTDELKQCDCCADMVRRLYFSVSYGLDTWACAKCRGIEEDEDDAPMTAPAPAQDAPPA
jgi:hypothetical protein